MNKYIKSLYISCLTSIFLISNSYSVLGQIFGDEQYPPSVKWRQIHTEHFQLIYPTELEREAQDLANRLERLRQYVGETMGKEPRKISIVLNNQTVESNGNVQLSPRRSEFYMTPPQSGDFQDWMNNLAIHELRHVVQFDKLTGYLRAPFFEQLALLIYGMTLPSWFFEGDAVVTETMYSPSGRGRLPSWEMPFRANLLSGKRYPYEKDYLGSLKDVTPGFYELGYFLSARLMREHDGTLIDSLMTRMAKLPIRPYNFSRSLRKFTGLNTRQWHALTREELAHKWQAELLARQPETYQELPVRASGKPENWLLPQVLPDGRILALHQGYGQVPVIVCIDTSGNLKRLIGTGRQTEPNFSHAAEKIVWDEVRRDGRYGMRTYSIINLYELSTGRYRQLTHRTRYFSPALRPDGQQLVAVSVGEDNTISLVLLDTQQGNIAGAFPSPGNMQIRTPAYDPSGTKVIAVGITNQGAVLIELDISSGKYRILLDWQSQQLERPVYDAQGRLIFKAHFDGVDNLYVLDTVTQAIARITNVRFGAFNPSVDLAKRRIWFNEYCPDGYRIAWTPIPDSVITSISTPIRTDRSLVISDTAGYEKWPSKPYNTLKNSINFHSLSVNAGNFDDLNEINPGLYWLSDDLLNTFSMRLGYTYDGNVHAGEYMASISYRRFLPRWSLTYRNRGAYGVVRDPEATEMDFLRLRWREHRTSLQLDIPLTFYHLNRTLSLSVFTAADYTRRYGLSDQRFQDRLIDRINFPLHHRISLSHRLRQSVLDLGPRWGQQFSVSYRHLPFDDQNRGEHLAIRTTFYFPGPWRHHTLVASFNYQRRWGTYQIADDIPLVSGYDQLAPIPADNTLLFRYRFPLGYPDWVIGPLAYIKRFSSGFFADFQNVRRDEPFRPRTFGLMLRTEMNLLRYYLPDFFLDIQLGYANERLHPRRTFATFGFGYRY